MPGEHARLAPSGSSRWMACPGSLALIESLPPDQQDRPNPDSVRGTACHEVLARSLDENRSPRSFVGQTIIAEPDLPVQEGSYTMPIKEGSYTITEEDAANVDLAYQYVISRLMEYGENTTWYSEEKVDCGVNFAVWSDAFDALVAAPVEEGVCTGTPDVVMVGGGYAEVVDYKNGYWHVDHVGNTQLLLYLIGALKHVERGQVQRYRLTIIQPRADGHEPIRTWEFEEAAIIEHVDRLSRAAHEALALDPPRVPGEEQCRFCPAKAVCPELNQQATAALTGAAVLPQGAALAPGESFDNAPQPQPVEVDQDLVGALTMQPEQMGMDQLSRILEARDMIRSWLNAVESYALQTMLKGYEVPGFKLVAGRRSRSWSEDEDAMVKRFGNWNRINEEGKSAGKLKKDSYTTLSLISPAQAEKTIKPIVTPRTWDSIKKYIDVKEGKPTIAHITDTRQAITMVSSKDVFGTLTDVDMATSDVPDFLK